MKPGLVAPMNVRVPIKAAIAASLLSGPRHESAIRLNAIPPEAAKFHQYYI
jgi:hypothetical protein